jgi:hypothetical protein
MFKQTFSALVVCSVLAGGAAFAADPTASGQSTPVTGTLSSQGGAVTPAPQPVGASSATGSQTPKADIQKASTKTVKDRAPKKHHHTVHKELTGGSDAMTKAATPAGRTVADGAAKTN